MVINVECADKMIEDICEYLDIVPEYLRERILDIADDSMNDKCFNDEKFRELSYSFISEYNNEQIEEIYLCHLTRSIDMPKLLMPLKELLTSDNSFSSFLKENKITFSYQDSKLIMEYNGKKISPKNIYDYSKVENEHTRLAARLGYLGEKDFCINGFLFAIEPENSTDGYYQLLMEGPELLQDIDAFLSTNLIEEYQKHSKYYFAMIRVPLSRIIFDEKKEWNNFEDKTRIFLTCCFEFLMTWYEKTECSLGLYNKMMRLDDYSSAVVDHYIELEDFYS